MTTANPQPDPAGQEANDSGPDARRTPDGLTVIGIGASAGGLAPLRTFFSALPPNTGMTFVVVVHLSPEHESMLPELLRDYTDMAVTQVQARTPMQPNHVYVIPPAKRLVVAAGELDLEELDQAPGRRLQIDTFFRTLAEQHGDGAAIILSGTGSDGAVGMRAVKEEGGLLLVQAPQEAEYDGMPKSAIATGLVDVVAPVAELAAQLVAAKRTKETLELPAEPQDLAQREQQTLLQILAQLRVRTGHDFSGYKEATLLRRIARRMQLLQLNTLGDYLNRLRQDAEEVDALYRDVLIHVTEFFRDAEAWSVLANDILPQLFEGKGPDDAVRVWTVGCATGEEAYSAAILLLEHAGQLNRPPQIQVFASDLGRIALDFARKGIYPEAIAADVPEARLNRYFVHENSHYQVRSEVRELVLFTPHNLLQDPPFSKLDLVICRNVLIYLQRPVQEHVFEAFHYALRPTGFLFLGSAESTYGVTELFETVDKRHRLYRRGAATTRA
ncbi:MAG: CheR family methyltransferase [Caldilineaceae bacterium]